MSFEEVCSYLVQEPYNLSIKQIANLTDRQITYIYFRPRKKSKDVGFDGGGAAGYQASFIQVWASRGMPMEKIKEKWIKDFPNRPWQQE